MALAILDLQNNEGALFPWIDKSNVVEVNSAPSRQEIHLIVGLLYNLVGEKSDPYD